MNILIIFAAKYLFLVSLAMYVLYALHLYRSDRPALRRFLLLSIFSFPLAFLLAKASGYVIADPRPFIVDQITPLVDSAVDNGFPSDHTLLAMTVAAIILVFDKRLGTALVAIGVIVGAGRVMAGVHHPLDVAGSILIAAIATAAVYIVQSKLRPQPI